MTQWIKNTYSITDPGSHWLWLGIAVGILMILLLCVLALSIGLRLRNNKRSQQWRRIENKWQPLLLDYLAGDISSEIFHQEISRPDQSVFIELLARFAAQVQGHERSMLEDLATPFLKSLATDTKNSQTGKRARAVRLIGILGLPTYKDAMIVALKDPELPVRMAAAQALIHNKRCQDVDAILENLERFEEVTDNYMSSLLASAGHEAQPYMRIFMAMPDPPASLRAIAARALLLMKDFEAAGIAAEIITPSIPPQLLLSCLGILAEMGEDTHAPSIRKLLPMNDPNVLAAICRALGQVGDQQDYETFHFCMKHPSPWVNLSAAQAFGSLGAAKELHEYLESDPRRRELALEILTSTVEEEPEPVLIGGDTQEGLIG